VPSYNGDTCTLRGARKHAVTILWTAALLPYVCIYTLALILEPRPALAALAFGYMLVIAIGVLWWRNERRRQQIIRGVYSPYPDRLLDLWKVSLLFESHLFFLFAFIFYHAHVRFGLYDVPADATQLSWALFTLDSFFSAASFQITDILGVQISSIRLSDEEPRGRYLFAASRLTYQVILVAGFWRTVEVYAAIRDAVCALDRNEELARRVGRRATNALIRALEHENWVVRQNAAKALGEIRDSRAVDDLSSRLLEDPKWQVRMCAATALGEIANKRAEHALCQSVRNMDEVVTVVREAVVALTRIGGGAAVGTLCELLISRQRPEPTVRREVAKALGALGDRRAVEALCRAMDDFSDELVREYAANSLGQLRDVDAIRRLRVAAAEDPCAAVRQAATVAIALIEQHLTQDIRDSA
jgi:HEAT repeat protein